MSRSATHPKVGQRAVVLLAAMSLISLVFVQPVASAAATITVTAAADIAEQVAIGDQPIGTGTINGELSPTSDPYPFIAWAADDTFRISIWWENNGVDQPLGGGSIVIHTK